MTSVSDAAISAENIIILLDVSPIGTLDFLTLSARHVQCASPEVELKVVLVLAF